MMNRTLKLYKAGLALLMVLFYLLPLTASVKNPVDAGDPLYVKDTDVIARTLRFKRFGMGEGFPQVSVTSIIQDRKGFMWFGTYNGLIKYDGIHFTQYHYKHDGSGLVHRVIRYIYEDSEGLLWINTSAGLDQFAPETETVTHYRAGSQETSTLHAARGNSRNSRSGYCGLHENRHRGGWGLL
ncbi:MAG: hypothetical protein GY757_10560 [bacterium]|nr:hypothetical protein [bacterium]